MVGPVRVRVHDGEAERVGARRAWTEDISCRADRRRQGIATGLIVSALRTLAAQGFEQAALATDYDNAHNALGLYQSLGYEVVQRDRQLIRWV